jgi:hypothetical protein
MVEFGVARVIVDGFDAGPIEHTREELIPHGFRL